ncbi:MAG: hypothetical protein ACYDBQ_11780 [Thermoplasmatota archaeon]
MPHVQLYTGVVIVRKRDAAGLVSEIRSLGASIQTRVVCLEKGDVRTLNAKP